MPPQWENQPGGIDCIDLTSDSPPPQPRRPPRQPNFPNHLSVESGASSSSTYARTGTRRASPSPNRFPAASTQPVTQDQGLHPEQLRQIITSSDPHALQAVLLDLCRLSPALSGAIARGLASHSTYTRNILNRIKEPRIQHRQERTRPGFEAGESSRSHFNVKREFGGSSVPQTSVKREFGASSRPQSNVKREVGGSSRPQINVKRALGESAGSQVNVKKESGPPLNPKSRALIEVLTDSSEDDSDGEDLDSPSNRASAVQPVQRTVAERPKPKASEPTTSRRYHPDSIISAQVNNKIVKIYRCCKAPFGEIGCQIAESHAEPLSAVDMDQRGEAGPSGHHEHAVRRGDNNSRPLCENCGGPYVDDEYCYWHPGGSGHVKNDFGEIEEIYLCCNQQVRDRPDGCQLETSHEIEPGWSDDGDDGENEDTEEESL